jgi:hypothetical protein
MLLYEFDTTGVVKAILRGILGLLAVVIVPGILYSLFVSHSTAAAVQLLLIAGVTAIFGRIFSKNLTGSRGVVTPDAVVVQPSRLHGIRLAGPAAGTFPMRQFKAVRGAQPAVPGRGRSRSGAWHADRAPRQHAAPGRAQEHRAPPTVNVDMTNE